MAAPYSLSASDSVLGARLVNAGMPSPTVSSNVYSDGTIATGGSNADKAARVMRAQWERYVNTFTPVEDQLINSIGQDMTGEAMAGAREATARAGEVTDRTLGRYGLAGIPGQDVAADRQRQSALAQAEAFNDTSIAQVDRNQNIRAGLVDVGQSLLNQSTGGLAQAASMEGQRETAYDQASRAHKQAKQAQTTQTVATVAMMAMMMM